MRLKSEVGRMSGTMRRAILCQSACGATPISQAPFLGERIRMIPAVQGMESPPFRDDESKLAGFVGVAVNVFDPTCRFAGKPGGVEILDIIVFGIEQIDDL